MTLESIVTIRGISVEFEPVARPIVPAVAEYLQPLADSRISFGPPDGRGRAVGDV